MARRELVVVTSELRPGDVVLAHGMRCLIDRPILVSSSHPDRPGVGDGKTRYTQALVLNRDEVPTEVVPLGWTADWKRNAKYEPRPHDGEHRWTIQGNDHARWRVEREELGADLDMHADGQTRLGCAGDQLAVLPLPALELEEGS